MLKKRMTENVDILRVYRFKEDRIEGFQLSNGISQIHPLHNFTCSSSSGVP